MRSKKALYNIGTNLVLQIIMVIYGFVVPKIIISKFGSNVNGLVSSITQFLGYISLLESGFGPVVKAALYKPIAKNDKDSIGSILKTSENFFKRIAYIFIIYIFILAMLYPLIINSNFEYIYTVSLILIISISIFSEYYFGMTYKLYLQADQKNYVISLIQIITYILNIIFVIILARVSNSIHIIKLVTCIIFVLRPIFQNLYVKKKYNINLKDNIDKYELKNKWDGLAQHIAAVIHTNTDVTILTFFCTLAEVSVYSVYYLVVKGVKSIIQAFTNGIGALFGNMLAKKEMDNLNKKFDIFEVFYNMIITIIFSCTLVLIVPFVSVYTKNITDANYIRYTFGYLIVISELVWAIRLPYSSITLAAGHFKETRIGAWFECLSNIVISLVLVIKFGIVGVAIGTIIAMTIRTFEFVYHTNKHILNRTTIMSINKIVLIIIETLMVVFISNYLPMLNNTNYLNWGINAIMTFALSSIIVLIMNFLFYRKQLVEFIHILKNILKRKKKA